VRWGKWGFGNGVKGTKYQGSGKCEDDVCVSEVGRLMST
jgi:hypothetical protein